ncbi:hypothetical protein KOW79_003325 [Hemibagrus wyckioides]|uniref:Neuritin-like protein n=1 Tax=Hemibagrus wyckioides TaxID=337641 RepID=A0A9D3P1Z1_9TELE|nr:hypothetical protein KOW79_003325 [Hemibagrus wyckioides]
MVPSKSRRSRPLYYRRTRGFESHSGVSQALQVEISERLRHESAGKVCLDWEHRFSPVYSLHFTMASLGSVCFLLPVAFHLLMVPSLSSMAAARRCGSIYKGFAQCLLALGDSLSVSSQKEEDLHEIDSVCRSWDEFHDCANLAMAGCPEEAAAVWESLRQESKKMQFAGNLYDMCSSRSQSAADTGAQNPDETNQESLKGKASHLNLGRSIFLPICLCLLFLYLWI